MLLWLLSHLLLLLRSPLLVWLLVPDLLALLLWLLLLSHSTLLIRVLTTELLAALLTLLRLLLLCLPLVSTLLGLLPSMLTLPGLALLALSTLLASHVVAPFAVGEAGNRLVLLVGLLDLLGMLLCVLLESRSLLSRQELTGIRVATEVDVALVALLPLLLVSLCRLLATLLLILPPTILIVMNHENLPSDGWLATRFHFRLASARCISNRSVDEPQAVWSGIAM